MLVLLLACHRSSPSGDDSAPSEVTDTDPKVFDPETDLEWHVVEGTDGDCGTPWPLASAGWLYGSSKSEQSGGAWSGVKPSLARGDVWDLEFAAWLQWGHASMLEAHSQWRIQCDDGRMLLLGLVFGWNSSTDDMYVKQSNYAASFETPIAIGLADSTFEVPGQLWVADPYGNLDPTEAETATFIGTVSNAGVDTIATPDGDLEATRLALLTDSSIFVELFPRLLWLSESAGLVQFKGPIGDEPFVITN